MAIASTNFIPLQANSTGDAEALGLKVWMGDVAGAYFQSSVTEGLFNYKGVGGGLTEAQWVVTARRGSEYFIRGEDILEGSGGSGQSTDYLETLPTQEVTVKVDRPLIAPSFLDRQDSILTHFDSQAEMRRQSGQELARTVDLHRMICITRGAHRIDGGSSGTEVNTFVSGLKANATAFKVDDFADSADTDGSLTQAGIALMAERFDENDVPDDGRVMFVNPQVYHFILDKLDDYIDRDFAGEGSKARAMIPYCHGFRIVKTTNLPNTQYTHPTGAVGGSSGNKYTVDATGLKALFATRDALAEVRLGGGFGGESAYIQERMGTMVNSYWVGGMKELRPEACGAIYLDALPSTWTSPNSGTA